MVNPLLNLTLHTHLHQPINIVGCRFIIRWTLHKCVNLFLAVLLLRVDSVYLHPCQELTVVNDVLFKWVAHLIDKVNMHIGIVRINLTTTFIDWHEDWLDTRGRLCHQRGGTRWCDGQTGNITTTILLHILVKLSISLLQTKDERIFLLTLRIIYLKGSTLLSHCHRWAVSTQCQGTMNLNREVGCLLSTIA